MKDTFISLRVSQEDKEEIEKEAQKQHRNTSNYLTWTHHEYIKQKNNETDS
jgi:hypothetical protein|tara:strand:+ start:607 stop:759 length:153 start_codon:yes stop_codon:yes gene_type:complete